MDSATIASKLATYDAAPVTQTDALNEALKTYGVPEIRQRVAGLRTTINNTQSALDGVDPSVTGRTSQSLVTEAQRARMVNNERAPIADELNNENNNYGLASADLKDATDQASTEAAGKVNDWTTGRANLQSEYNLTYGREQDAAKAKADAEAAAEAKAEADRDFALKSRAQSFSESQAGSQVDPAKEFLTYIGNQFKSAGGAGNSKVTRQMQDAWANAWFAQNGVSNANRQGYWDLFNKTYNRTSDPTKDWRYAK